MKHLRTAALSALITTLGALGWAGSAAGALATTTLEVGGEAKGESVEITASLNSGSSLNLSRTDGSFANTCTESHLNASSESPYHGAGVTGPLSSLSFSSCTRPVTVHKAGQLYVEHIESTTNGTVFSENAEVTVGSPFGTLNCKTGTGTDIGTLTGVKEGHATIDVNAVLNCGFLVPSAKWTGTYEITSPTGLGVIDEDPPDPPLTTTTLEVGGEAKGESVEITASLNSGSSLNLSRTDGSFANTCTESHLNASSESPYHGAGVTGPLSSLSFSSCTRPVTVHKAGQLYVEHIESTTNGTVFSENAEVTVGSPFGTLNCKTGTGTDIGTLTGVKEGHATIDVNAVLNCGFLVPSAKWTGTYEITSPTGLGVIDEDPPDPPLPTTTLEVGGTPKGEPVEVTASLASGSSSLLARTDGTFANTCTASHASASTESPYSGETVTAPTSSLSFSSCTRPVTVHKAGTLHIEHIPGTTNGTVSSSAAEVTVGSIFGTLNCQTGAGTDIGTLTGKKEGTATIDINGVINCGFLVPSAKWSGTYEVTSPSGLGVTS